MKRLIVAVCLLFIAGFLFGVNPYMSVRYGFWYEEDFDFNQQANSRAGFRHTGEGVNAQVEFGIKGNVRLFWLERKISDNYTVTVGRADVINQGSGQVYGDIAFTGYGGTWLLQQPLIRIRRDHVYLTVIPREDTDNPVINIGTKGRLFTGTDLEITATFLKDKQDAYLMTGHLAGKIKQITFIIHTNIGRNIDHLNVPVRIDPDGSGSVAEDINSVGGFVQVGKQITPWGSLQGGLALFNIYDRNVMSWFVNIPVTIAPGISIIPETGSLDKAFYVGSQIRVNL